MTFAIPPQWARLFALLLLTVMLSIAGSASAQGRIYVSGELVTAAPTVRAGEETMLALHMVPEPGWHGYWVNGGDAGFGMELAWTLPDGVKVGEPRYPVPETYILQGLMNHVYEAPYAILIPVTFEKDVPAGTRMTLAADGNWLACSDTLCLPQEGRFVAEVTVVAADAPEPARDPRFAQWQAKLPSALTAPVTYRIEGEALTLSVPFPADAPLTSAHFFAETDGLIDYAAKQDFARDGDMLTITTKAASGAKMGDVLTGILKIGPDRGLTVNAKPGTAGSGAGSGLDSVGGPGGLLLTLGAALLGGVLLNIMPCVFPILGLKALTLARGAQDERSARREALAYTGGVMATTLILGGILLALRASGEQVGWAFQLQNPAVVLFLLMLMAAIALNLLGLFEVPGMAGVGGISGKSESSFMTGALAAFVATPCTGPFMAAALGAALILPTAAALALFAALGLGIALPFLAIGFVPALRKALPKPGPWLSIFRRWMALPMILTAAALFWLWAQMGGAFWVAAMCILLLGIILTIAGKAQFSGRRAAPVLAGAAALCIAAPAAVSAFPAVSVTTLDRKADDSAVPFSRDRLANLRKNETPVFLYFTADWCITCKANEAAVLNRADIVEGFAEKGITVMRADFTRHDAAIAAFLAERGRAGVPLYLYFPKTGEPTELPQILTQDIVKSAIARG